MLGEPPKEKRCFVCGATEHLHVVTFGTDVMRKSGALYHEWMCESCMKEFSPLPEDA